ncbi:MAG: hypothetical protein IPN22_11330 [Bacteroidetes bacterium]|nr:hypothetical protein [Bacteroidota bacterium]
MQDCVNWFCHYANLFKIHSEFLVVNYNPIEENSSITEAINFPLSAYVKFKIITVEASFHNSISHKAIRKNVPLYEYIAKNIGIRRATGEYIVSGNPDVIWDVSIFKFIAQKKLQVNCYYRADRADFSGSLPPLLPNYENLQLIRNSVFKMFKKGFKYECGIAKCPSLKILSLEIMNRWHLFRELKIAEYETLSKKLNLNINYNNVEYEIHTNASGDFFMMHNSKWHELKGHPENTYLSIHTDSISIAMARYSGLKEKVFFYLVYHRDHSRRFVPETKDADIESMYDKFETDAKWMRKTQKPIIYNDDNWGFPEHNFHTIQYK